MACRTMDSETLNPSDGVGGGNEIGDRRMPELIIEHIDRQIAPSRHFPHGHIEDALKENAGEERIIFCVLGRGDEIDDGFALAQFPQFETGSGRQSGNIGVGQRTQRRDGRENKTPDPFFVSGEHTLPFIP